MPNFSFLAMEAPSAGSLAKSRNARDPAIKVATRADRRRANSTRPRRIAACRRERFAARSCSCPRVAGAAAAAAARRPRAAPGRTAPRCLLALHATGRGDGALGRRAAAAAGRGRGRRRGPRGPGRPRRRAGTRSTSTGARPALRPQRGRRLRPGRAGAAPRGRRATALAVGDDGARGGPALRVPVLRAAAPRAFVHADGQPHLRRARHRRRRARHGAVPGRPAPRGRVLHRPRPRAAAAPSPRASRPTARCSCGRACPAAGRSTATPSRSRCTRAGRSTSSTARCRRREALVGVSPGRRPRPDAPPTSSAGAAAGASRARWSSASARRRSWTSCRRCAASTRRTPTSFEQLVVYTTRPLNPLPGSLAFEVNVRNDVRGHRPGAAGPRARNGAAPGALESVVYMDSVDPYLERGRLRDPGPRGRPPLARAAARSATRAARRRRPARPRRRALELLPRHGRVGDGGQRHRGPRRRPLRDRGLRARLQRRSTSTRWACARPRRCRRSSTWRAPDDFRPNRAYKASSAPGGRRELHRRAPGRCGSRTWWRAWGRACPPRRRAPRVLRQAYVLVADAVAPATEARRRGGRPHPRALRGVLPTRPPTGAARSDTTCPERVSALTRDAS